MAERPIIFSAPMIRALLAGTKTQTRRIVKPSRKQVAEWSCNLSACTSARVTGRGDLSDDTWLQFDHPRGGPYSAIKSPYGTGDTLWVREAWWKVVAADGPPATAPGDNPGRDGAFYRTQYPFAPPCPHYRAMPSIFMPRWASRITLHVTDVRVQRLQEISEEDARAEGCRREYLGPPDAVDLERYTISARASFSALWDGIHGAGRGAWDANPWVVAVSFEHIDA